MSAPNSIHDTSLLSSDFSAPTTPLHSRPATSTFFSASPIFFSSPRARTPAKCCLFGDYHDYHELHGVPINLVPLFDSSDNGIHHDAADPVQFSLRNSAFMYNQMISSYSDEVNHLFTTGSVPLPLDTDLSSLSAENSPVQPPELTTPLVPFHDLGGDTAAGSSSKVDTKVRIRLNSSIAHQHQQYQHHHSEDNDTILLPMNLPPPSDVSVEFSDSEAWSQEEDRILRQAVAEHGTKKWSNISAHLTGRTAKACKDRWNASFDPKPRKERWSKEEDLIMIHEQARVGNSWNEIAGSIPGRTSNAVKNHWNSSVRRKLEKLGITLAELHEKVRNKEDLSDILDKIHSVDASIPKKSSENVPAQRIIKKRKIQDAEDEDFGDDSSDFEIDLRVQGKAIRMM